MWPYLEEMFNTDQFALDIFRKECSWSSRSRCGTCSYLSLQEIIDNNEYVRNLNGDDKYFKFMYG